MGMRNYCIGAKAAQNSVAMGCGAMKARAGLGEAVG
jgi:hypothetical protein